MKLNSSEISSRDGRQFEASCAQTLGWLSENMGALSERLLVSADREILQQQLEHHEVINFHFKTNRNSQICQLYLHFNLVPITHTGYQ